MERHEAKFEIGLQDAKWQQGGWSGQLHTIN